jgi:hypothetical protein
MHSDDIHELVKRILKPGQNAEAEAREAYEKLVHHIESARDTDKVPKAEMLERLFCEIRRQVGPGVGFGIHTGAS